MNNNYTLVEAVSFNHFVDSFSDTYKNNFSYKGKQALYDYLIQLADDLGENIELDTVALCCDYTEFDNLEDYNSQYDKQAKSIEDVENDTQVIRIEGSEGFIIQQY